MIFLLLKAAALLHDIGYTVSTAEHEEKSCELQRKFYLNIIIPQPRLKLLCKMIMATKIPQKPTNHLSKILCDADLSYLGTDTYSREAEKLYLEFKNLNPAKTPEEWLHEQINFLNAHHYFTETANKQFKEKKNKNLSSLKSQLPKKKLLLNINLQFNQGRCCLNFYRYTYFRICFKKFFGTKQFF